MPREAHGRRAIVAVAVLLAAASSAAETVGEAIRGLAARDPAVRSAAVRRLGLARTQGEREQAVAALVPRLGDPSPAVRTGVAAALAHLDDARAAPAVARRLAAERDPEVQPALLVALGELGGPEHEPLVLPFASNAGARVRAAAWTALGDLAGPRARGVLLSALDRPGQADPDWTLRSSVVLALSKCGKPEDLEAILRAFGAQGGSDRWFARVALARAIAALDPDPSTHLRLSLDDEDPRVVSVAAEGIARRCGAGEARRLLEDPRARVRAAAAAAVARVRLAELAPRLQVIARLDPSRDVRWASIAALFRLEDPTGEEMVLSALSSDDPAIWADAVALLAERTGAAHGRDAAAWRAELRRARSAR